MIENLRNLLENMTINSAACKAKQPNLTSQELLDRLIDDIPRQSQGGPACRMKFGQCWESLEAVALLHGYTKLFTDWKEALNKKMKR
ncbi:hypothetical protein GJAV_G00134810 [Gymnothorax javanicus]|nr:hypothetical protein GJAV_G00134810 [Gymnothorax javanicus]